MASVDDILNCISNHEGTREASAGSMNRLNYGQKAMTAKSVAGRK